MRKYSVVWTKIVFLFSNNNNKYNDLQEIDLFA